MEGYGWAGADKKRCPTCAKEEAQAIRRGALIQARDWIDKVAQSVRPAVGDLAQLWRRGGLQEAIAIIDQLLED